MRITLRASMLSAFAACLSIVVTLVCAPGALAGAITEFPIPTANSIPKGITAGPDGNLWFTEDSADKIGRITPSGTGGTPQPPPVVVPQPPPVVVPQPVPQPLPVVVTCLVPKLKGKTLTQAKRLLTRSHCRLGKVTQAKKHRKHKLVVVSQKPGAGKTLPSGAKVAVRLG